MRQEIAGELGGIALSSALATTLARAAEVARRHRHRQISLEHLLLALCEDEEAAVVLSACSIDLARLHDETLAFLEQLGDSASDGGTDLAVAPELKRILDYAAAAAQQGGRTHVNGAIVLAAMVGEGRSTAAKLLQAQGLTFESAVHVLQEQSRAQAPPVVNGASTQPPSTEEILALARERVEASRGGTGRPRGQSPASGTDAPTSSEQGGAPAGEVREPKPAPGQAQPGSSLSINPDGNAQARPAQRPGGPPPLPLQQAMRPSPDAGSANGVDPDQPPTRPQLPTWMTARRGKVHGGAASRPDSPPGTHNDGPANPSPAVPKMDRAPAQEAATAARGGAGSKTSAKPAVQAGQLVENIPRRMVVGVSETVEVRIGREDAEGVAAGLQGRGTPARHDLFVTKAMSVRLRAPQGGFDIDAASPETQWLEPNVGPLSGEFAAWRFAVTPRRRGESVLQLIVAARTLGTDGVMADTALPERVISVRVRTNYGRAVLRSGGWLAALLVGGVVGKLGEETIQTLIRLVSRVAGG